MGRREDHHPLQGHVDHRAVARGLSALMANEVVGVECLPGFPRVTKFHTRVTLEGRHA